MPRATFQINLHIFNPGSSSEWTTSCVRKVWPIGCQVRKQRQKKPLVHQIAFLGASAEPKQDINKHFLRGGGKKNGKSKKGHKKGKKEGYDLIVNINLEDWKLSPEQVNILFRWFLNPICQTNVHYCTFEL